MNLTRELILYVIRDLSNERDRQSFALCNKKLWSIATTPSLKPFTLNRRISSLNIRRLIHLVIGQGFYEPELVRHVLTYATNLRNITFAERKKFPIKFIQTFMVVQRSCEFLVPAKAYTMFIATVEDSENEYITLKVISDSRQERAKTPEEIERKMQLLKSAEKAKYFADTNNNVVMKDELSHLVPYHTNRLFPINKYVLYDNSHAKAEITSEKEANSIVLFCSKFMEAVVVLENYWFFCTSYSIFIHNKNIDDCADNSLVGTQKEAVSFIRKKTRAGYDYFELTTRFNNVELLSASGFFGDVNSNTVSAFVGSAIQNLPSSLTKRYDTVSSEYIFIPVISAPFEEVERLLNQYVKKQAKNKWMHISQKYKEQGFTPNHPLSFTAIDNTTQTAASLLLKIFVNKTLYGDELKAIMLSLQKKSVRPPTDSKALIEKYLMDLSTKEEFLVEKYDLTQVKKDMLYIYEHTLAGVLKRKNNDVIKKAENKYNPTTVSLFDEVA